MLSWFWHLPPQEEWPQLHKTQVVLNCHYPFIPSSEPFEHRVWAVKWATMQKKASDIQTWKQPLKTSHCKFIWDQLLPRVSLEKGKKTLLEDEI